MVRPAETRDVWKEEVTLIGVVNASSQPRRTIGVHLSKLADDLAIERTHELRETNRKLGLKDKMPNLSDKQKLTNDILGTRGELAVSYATGLPCKDWTQFKEWPQDHVVDIGSIYEVRTRDKHHHDLLLYPNDNPDHVFILAT